MQFRIYVQTSISVKEDILPCLEQYRFVLAWLPGGFHVCIKSTISSLKNQTRREVFLLDNMEQPLNRIRQEISKDAATCI